MSNRLAVTRTSTCVGGDDWLRLNPLGQNVVDTAEEIAAKHTDTTPARAFLTRSILTLNDEALHRKSSEAYGWVPDRNVGEIAIFGFPGMVTCRSAEQATAEAYAAQNPSRFAAASNLKVVECFTDIYQCPAGPMVFISSVQRQRRTTTLITVAEAVVFPEVEGLNEGVSLRLFNLSPENVELAGNTGRFTRMMANSLAVEIGRPDGSTFTVGPWGVGA